MAICEVVRQAVQMTISSYLPEQRPSPVCIFCSGLLCGVRLDLSNPKSNLAEDSSRPYLVEDLVKDMQMAFRTTANPKSSYYQLSFLFPFTGANLPDISDTACPVLIPGKLFAMPAIQPCSLAGGRVTYLPRLAVPVLRVLANLLPDANHAAALDLRTRFIPLVVRLVREHTASLKSPKNAQEGMSGRVNGFRPLSKE